MVTVAETARGPVNAMSPLWRLGTTCCMITDFRDAPLISGQGNKSDVNILLEMGRWSWRWSGWQWNEVTGKCDDAGAVWRVPSVLLSLLSSRLRSWLGIHCCSADSNCILDERGSRACLNTHTHTHTLAVSVWRAGGARLCAESGTDPEHTAWLPNSLPLIHEPPHDDHTGRVPPLPTWAVIRNECQAEKSTSRRKYDNMEVRRNIDGAPVAENTTSRHLFQICPNVSKDTLKKN